MIERELLQRALESLTFAEPVAWRFTHNRGNGKTAFTYHDSDDYATAYRDTCLETTPLYTAPSPSPFGTVMVMVPLEPTLVMLYAAKMDERNHTDRRTYTDIYHAMLAAASEVSDNAAAVVRQAIRDQ